MSPLITQQKAMEASNDVFAVDATLACQRDLK